jgi:hypothetical protein
MDERGFLEYKSGMPYFHATRKHLLPSIFERGLGGAVIERNFDCEPGVYLSEDPMLGGLFLFESIMTGKTPRRAATPRDELASWIVIVIDDARIDQGRLKSDPQTELPGFWRYEGIIDVTGAAVVPFEQITPTHLA